MVALSFLGWGFLRGLNDIVVAAHQVQRPTHDAAAMSIHVSFFAAYLLFPIPASAAIHRFGLRIGLAASVAIIGISALFCSITLRTELGLPYLVSLTALAAGIATLQTSGNPAATLLGPQRNGAQRLLAVQSAMSIGAAIASLCSGFGRSAATFDPGEMFAGARIIYFTIGSLLMLLACALLFGAPIGACASASKGGFGGGTGSKMRPSERFAIVAVFLFVGTETTVLTHVLQFRRLTSPGSAFFWTVTLSSYWIFITIGRLLSSFLLKRAHLISLLRVSAIFGAVLVSLALVLRGGSATFVLLLTGLVNAAIFPSIFALSTRSLNETDLTSVSGRLMTAISGGALMPLLSATIADHAGIRSAFILPILSYIYIGITASRCRASN
jgi:FHS family L-fucose permease-like MFS transporter